MQKKLIIVTGLLCCLTAGISTAYADGQVRAENGSFPRTGEVDMYRLYNPNSGEHFYTANSGERNTLVTAGWNYEGVGWIAPESGVPVYRLYNANAGDHFYTDDSSERDSLTGAGWKYEGICWYSDADKSCPVYRQYNPNAKSGSHNFTTSVSEKNELVQAGWKDEDIAWYAKAAAGAGNTGSSNEVPDASSQAVSGQSRNVSNLGDAGNLAIPAIGTDLALNSNGDAQAIVDRENSAAYLEGWAQPVIADHNYQSNFRQLKNCSGQYCYVTRDGNTVRYRCVLVEAGKNTGSALLTASGKNVTTDHVSDLVIYTCQTVSEGGGVWITEWNAA